MRWHRAVTRESLPFLLFFFQAEDGIRDIGVTGVQTCALPISSADLAPRKRRSSRDAQGAGKDGDRPGKKRSEERRVGKECRSRWTAGHKRKKRATPSAS